MTRHAERDALSPAKRAWIIAALFCAFVDLAFLGDALLPGRVRAAGDIVAATPPASGCDGGWPQAVRANRDVAKTNPRISISDAPSLESDSGG